MEIEITNIETKEKEQVKWLLDEWENEPYIELKQPSYLCPEANTNTFIIITVILFLIAVAIIKIII